MSQRNSKYTRSAVGAELFEEIRTTGRLITSTDEPEGKEFQTWFKPSTNEFYEHDGTGWVLKGTVSTPIELLSINDLNDVLITEPVSNNEVLRFNGTTVEWENKINDRLQDATGIHDLLTPATTGPDTIALVSDLTGQELNDLTDVNITTPAFAEVLRYNTTTSKWENETNNVMINQGGTQPIYTPATTSPETFALRSDNIYNKVEVSVVQTFKTLVANLQAGSFVDGVSVGINDIVLIAGQDGSNPAFPLIENGPYLVNATAPPTRLAVGAPASAFEYVADKGVANAGSCWQSEQETSKSIYGSDDITFGRRDVATRYYGGLYINTTFAGTTNATPNTFDQFLGWTNSATTTPPIVANPALDKIIIDLTNDTTHTFSISYNISWSKGGGGVEDYVWAIFKNVNASGDVEMTMSKSVRQHSNNDIGGVSGEAYLQVLGGDTVDITLKVASNVASSSYSAVSGMLRIEQLN
jgi:hypothetical protein